MDPATIRRLEQSLDRLAPRGRELVDRFYESLFLENPGLRPMFPANLAEPKNQLLSTLGRLIDQAGRAGDPLSLPVVFGCGAGDGRASREQQEIMRETLIVTMAEMLRDSWDTQLSRAWRQVFDLVASAAGGPSHLTATTAAC